jgi:predicted membrane protein
MFLEVIQNMDSVNNFDLNFNWFITLLGTVSLMLITYFIKQAKEKHDESHSKINKKLEDIDNKNIKFREDYIKLQNQVSSLDDRVIRDFKHIEDKIDTNNKILIDKLSENFKTFDEKLSDLKEMFKEFKNEKR